VPARTSMSTCYGNMAGDLDLDAARRTKLDDTQVVNAMVVVGIATLVVIGCERDECAVGWGTSCGPRVHIKVNPLRLERIR
jgi:hypothetical protein